MFFRHKCPSLEIEGICGEKTCQQPGNLRRLVIVVDSKSNCRSSPNHVNFADLNNCHGVMGQVNPRLTIHFVADIRLAFEGGSHGSLGRLIPVDVGRLHGNGGVLPRALCGARTPRSGGPVWLPKWLDGWPNGSAPFGPKPRGHAPDQPSTHRANFRFAPNHSHHG